MSTDWFRNTTWSESVERAFNEKLRRARDKRQYLRVQAYILAESQPEVALKLLDCYFELPPDIDEAQPHVDRATALLALGRMTDAISAYEAALAREVAFPSVQTQAYLELPYLVATHAIREQYTRALELLQLHKSRMVFPVEHFLWHAAQAMIAADTRESELSSFHARHALEAANRRHSGFRHHASSGLVNEQYVEVIARLKRMCTP